MYAKSRENRIRNMKGLITSMRSPRELMVTPGACGIRQEDPPSPSGVF